MPKPRRLPVCHQLRTLLAAAGWGASLRTAQAGAPRCIIEETLAQGRAPHRRVDDVTTTKPTQRSKSVDFAPRKAEIDHMEEAAAPSDDLIWYFGYVS
jgi:hypothetical protein